MSVRAVTSTTEEASPVQSIRCYDLHLDGRVFDANGNNGTFLIGTIAVTAAYAADSYSAAITGLAYTKYAYMVNLQLKSFSHLVVVASDQFTLSTLPASLRPATTQQYQIIVSNNGTQGVGTLEIATSGVMTIYNAANPAGFSAGVGGLPKNTSVTYTIN